MVEVVFATVDHSDIRGSFSHLHRIEIRMVAGFAEVAERKKIWLRGPALYRV